MTRAHEHAACQSIAVGISRGYLDMNILVLVHIYTGVGECPKGRIPGCSIVRDTGIMHKVFALLLVILAGCKADPGAQTVSLAQVEPAPTPTPIVTPTPSPSASPDPCPPDWVNWSYSPQGNFCESPLQGHTGDIQVAEDFCYMISSHVCLLGELIDDSLPLGEYVWTSNTALHRGPLLFYRATDGSYFGVIQGEVGGSDPIPPANLRYYCCKDPVQ